MANRQNRLPLLINDDEVKAITEYRWKHRVPSFAETVRQLIAKGLEAESAKTSEAA